jgi:hypothetical protein
MSKKIMKKLTFYFVLLLMAGMIPLFKITKASSTAIVYIDPAEITGLAIGETFTINIKIANVTNLAGWELDLYYSSSVLSAIEAMEGPFLKSFGNTYWFLGSDYRRQLDDNYNSTHGNAHLACALLGSATGATGSGILANITFQVRGAGSSPISIPLDETKLLDSTPGNPQPIPHTTSDGLVVVIAHDIAITLITLSKTVTNDTQVTINVTAANLGNYTATFNVTLYYGSTEIETKTVIDLPPSTNTILTFLWDTTPIPKGNYTITAFAIPILGENYTENNQYIDGSIVETIGGDVTGDYKIDIYDLFRFGKSFGTTPGQTGWNPNCDLNNDNEINIHDIFQAARNYGKEI